MRRPGRAALAAQGAVSGLLGWLYGSDLHDWWRLRSAEAAACSVEPSVALALLGVAVALGGLGVLGVALGAGRDGQWRPLRLAPIAGLTLLFVDFLVLSSVQVSVGAEQRAQLALASFAEAAGSAATPAAVPTDPAALRAMAADLGLVPYFSRGARVATWQVEVRERCPGPALDAGAAPPGTLLYCVSADRQRAWVTLVGVREGERFGAPAVVAGDGDWVAEVRPAPPVRDEEERDAPVGEGPTPPRP